jgi:hypothetical protein
MARNGGRVGPGSDSAAGEAKRTSRMDPDAFRKEGASVGLTSLDVAMTK